MALPKKGNRKITIDGEVFIWKIRKRPTYNEVLGVSYAIPIQHIDGGQILLANMGYCRGYNAKNGFTVNEFPVTPSMIEECIRKGIECGWKYKETSTPLELDCIHIVWQEAKNMINQFITRLKFLKIADNSLISSIINDAEELIKYGEYKIALENMLDLLSEYNIMIDRDISALAHKALIILHEDPIYLKIIYDITKTN